MLSSPRPLTVGELTDLVQQALAREPQLNDVLVEGEISNFTHHSSGHMYFTLKDKNCAIKAVMFRSWNRKLNFRPENGQQVFVRGDVAVYRRGGNYQINVYAMEPAGQGALALAFAQLKERLAAEGLFEQQRKRPLPPFPRRVGLVTSPQAAALQDFLITARQQAWPATLVLAPAQVQGQAGARSVVRGLEQLNLCGVDVIVVTRGGGSLEELWVFNEEAVARAVAASAVPVVSAVGHETDFTICDFAADARAATPTAAARLVLPERDGVLQQMAEQNRRLAVALGSLVEGKRRRLIHLTARPVLARPWQLLFQPRQNLDYSSYRLRTVFARALELRRQNLGAAAGRLAALNPLAVLDRGYTVLRDQQGIITSVARLRPGKKVELQLRDGKARAVIESVGRKDNE